MTDHDRMRDESAARLIERFGVGVHTLTIDLQRPAEAMPDADTDVLIFDASSPEGQLGAYVGEDEDGPIWVNAQGEGVANVIAWAQMPRLPVGRDPRRPGDLVPLVNGRSVDLGGRWTLPT